MPVVIGQITSSVRVADESGVLTDDATERIVQIAVARMKEELRAEIEAIKDGQVTEGKSEPSPF